MSDRPDTTDWHAALERGIPSIVDVRSLEISELQAFRAALCETVAKRPTGTGETAYVAPIRPADATSRAEYETAKAFKNVDEEISKYEHWSRPEDAELRWAAKWARDVFKEEELPDPNAHVFWSRGKKRWVEIPHERHRALCEKSLARYPDDPTVAVARERRGYRYFFNNTPIMMRVIHETFAVQSKIWYANFILGHYERYASLKRELFYGLVNDGASLQEKQRIVKLICDIGREAFFIGDLDSDKFWKFGGPEEKLERLRRQQQTNRTNAQLGGQRAAVTARQRKEAFIDAAVYIIEHQAEAWATASERQRANMVKRRIEGLALDCFAGGAKPVGSSWYPRTLNEVIGDGSLKRRLEKPGGY